MSMGGGKRSVIVALITILAVGLIALSVFAAQVPAHTPHYPHASYGIITYLSVDPTLQAPIYDWMASRFDYIDGDIPPDPHDGHANSVYWATYVDSAFVYADGMYQVQASAGAHHLVLENMMLHTTRDLEYNENFNYRWLDMQQFDAFEKLAGVAVHGVVLSDNNTFTDVTGSSYDNAHNITITNTLYVGYMEPFDQMNFHMSTPRVGGTVTYQYGNGTAWQALTPQSDGTNGLTATGKVSFYPPRDWVQQIVNGSQSKFWVRIVVSGATTPPAYSRVFGDDWRITNTPPNNARGWAMTWNGSAWVADAPACPGNTPNGTSCRINIGTRLEYNANPPSGASARFRYQARVTGIWYPNPNGMVGNPSNCQTDDVDAACNGSNHAWAQYLSDAAIAQANRSSYDALFFDDGAALPASVVAPTNSAAMFDYDQSGATSYVAEVNAELAEVKNRLHATFGPYFAVGINSGDPGLSRVGDWMLREGYEYNTYQSGAVFGGSLFQWVSPADDFLPVGATLFTGTGLDDATSGGTYTGAGRTSYCVAINSTGAPDTISWGTLDDNYYSNCSTTGGTNIPITGGVQPLSNGMTIRFTATTGHTIGDQWIFSSEQNVHNTKALFTCWDQLSDWVGGNGASAWHTVDRADRTPMLCRAMDLLGSNPNTGMIYNSAGFIYSTTDEVYTYGTPTTITTPVNSTTTTLQLASNAGCTPFYYLRIGNRTTGDTLTGSLSGTTFTPSSTIYGTYDSGNTAYCIQSQHQSQIPTPPLATVYKWGTWFPAMGVDLGAPDKNGLNHGYRRGGSSYGTGIAWLSGASISGNASACGTNCPDLWRRDFTKGIVLMRPYYSGVPDSEVDTPSSRFASKAHTRTVPAAPGTPCTPTALLVTRRLVRRFEQEKQQSCCTHHWQPHPPRHRSSRLLWRLLLPSLLAVLLCCRGTFLALRR